MSKAVGRISSDQGVGDLWRGVAWTEPDGGHFTADDGSCSMIFIHTQRSVNGPTATKLSFFILTGTTCMIQ